MRGRRYAPPTGGASTVEALVALLLTMLLLQLGWSATASARKATGRLMARSEALETERVSWHLLTWELSSGVAPRDWRVEAPRVLVLRAFRGLAEVCPSLASTDGATVRYRGMRLPEPAKDSLLVLTVSGGWRAVDLTGRTPGGAECPDWPPGPVERWRWDPPIEGRCWDGCSSGAATTWRTGLSATAPATGDANRSPRSVWITPGAP